MDATATTDGPPEGIDPPPGMEDRPAPAVFAAIARVMTRLPGIGKDDVGPASQGSYKYRGIEAVTRHLQTLCGEEGIVIWPRANVVEFKPAAGMNAGWFDAHVEVTWNVAGVDGIPLRPEPVTYGIGRDNNDKGVNKAMTQAYKYLLLQLFMVADGKDDADGHDYSGGRRPDDEVADPYVDGDTVAALTADIAALPESARKALRAEWEAVDPMTGETFLPLHPESGTPSVKALRVSMVPVVRRIVADLAKRHDASAPGSAPDWSSAAPEDTLAGEDTPEPSEGDTASVTGGECDGCGDLVPLDDLSDTPAGRRLCPPCAADDELYMADPGDD